MTFLEFFTYRTMKGGRKEGGVQCTDRLYQSCDCRLPTSNRQQSKLCCSTVNMISHFITFYLVIFLMMAVIPAQRSPYLHSSDPGVLPMYLPQGAGNRFGAVTEIKEAPKLHAGTMETEAFYNRVAQWPDQRKPFWYVNAAALQKQREQRQSQPSLGRIQPQNRQLPFVSRRLSSQQN